jgi:hypothetical protein
MSTIGQPFDPYQAQLHSLQNMDANKNGVKPGAEAEEEVSFADILSDIINKESEKFEKQDGIKESQKINDTLGGFKASDIS